MEKIVFLVILCFLFLLVACSEPEDSTTTDSSFVEDPTTYNVSVYTTTGDRSLLLEEQTSLVMKQERPGENLPFTATSISIDERMTYQEMDGFGAAMSESSAYLINRLPDDKRQSVIKDLFSNQGIRMNFVRIPMGASDFALDSYTYNDMPKGEVDLELTQFSIERDEAYVVPVLKDAFAENDQIKLIGSPWSAPAWMKTNEHLNGGSLKQAYYGVYSQYFVKFINAYQAHGLPMYAVTLQNEPLHEDSRYPSMKMTNFQQRDFVKVIGPAFEEAKIDTKIIAYDHNWDQRQYPYPIYQDKVASSYVAGAAYHCYAGEVSAQSVVQKAFPDKGIWFTECSGGAWATNFADNLMWNMENLFIGSINHFSKGVLLWNIALDENNGPKNNGCPNCRGVLTITSDGEIKKNEEYYSIGHFSKFVEPGALRIESKVTNNQNIIATAFVNPKGSVVIVVANKANNQQRVTLEYEGLKTQHVIPGKAVSTLVIHKSKNG